MLTINSLTPNKDVKGLDDFIVYEKSLQKFKPFDPFVIKIINEISDKFIKSQQKELVAVGFFFRKTNLENYKKSFNSHLIRLPIGTVFHIVPSNVDFLFLYSSLLSMLVGNANIVRLSSRTEIGVINYACELMNEIFQKYNYNGFNVITYDRNNDITKELSINCNMRVIWGNDETICNIRKFPIKSSAKELCFYDRFSFSIINIDEFLDCGKSDKQELIDNYYKDLYSFDQNACSSPKLIIWVGEDIVERFEFYNLLSKKADNYEIQDWSVINKEVLLNVSAADGIISGHKRYNKLTVATLNSLYNFSRQSGNCGYLFEYMCRDTDEIFDFISSSNKDQTITYYGLDSQFKNSIIESSKDNSLSRVVPIGSALNFSYIWDGYNLLEEFSKILVI